jgi:hypothetical protein
VWSRSLISRTHISTTVLEHRPAHLTGRRLQHIAQTSTLYPEQGLMTESSTVVTRLASHASGRLSGEKFCVYVANRLVIPSIRPEDQSKFATGELTLDKLTKAYIHERLEYQFAFVQSSAEAYELERRCRDGSALGAKPLLNPL